MGSNPIGSTISKANPTGLTNLRWVHPVSVEMELVTPDCGSRKLMSVLVSTGGETPPGGGSNPLISAKFIATRRLS